MKWKSSLLAAVAAAVALGAAAAPLAPPPRAEVVHWFTSPGEAAAIRVIAARYRAAGGVWIDTAVTGAEQARNVAVNRIIGGTPPAAAQFHASKQYLDLIEEDMLENVDDLARAYDWDRTLPAPLRKVIKANGHYYAVPMSIHMPAWVWYSKSAFHKAGVRKAPESMEELFAALDKLKAAGLVPLALGGQAWQHHVLLMALLVNTADKDLYLRVYRDKEPGAVRSELFRKTLLAYKRLRHYVDEGAPGRDWDRATALLLRGEAGVQIMGDWVKGEIIAAGLEPGGEIGCIPAFNPHAPLIIQSDAFIFPKGARRDVQRAQKLLANVMAAPQTQLAFSRVKGSVPLGANLDSTKLDACTRTALTLLKANPRHVGPPETYLTAGQNSEIEKVLVAYWNSGMPVEAAQQGILTALQR